MSDGLSSRVPLTISLGPKWIAGLLKLVPHRPGALGSFNGSKRPKSASVAILLCSNMHSCGRGVKLHCTCFKADWRFGDYIVLLHANTMQYQGSTKTRVCSQRFESLKGYTSSRRALPVTPICTVLLLAVVDFPLRIIWCSCANAAPRRMALIFNGSAKLQLFFNWLPGWVNNEYLPVVRLSAMKKQ